MSEHPIREVLLASLRDEPGSLDRLASLRADLVEDAAIREGVAPLLAEKLAGTATCPGLAKQLRAHAQREALVDVIRHRELLAVLDAFSAASVPVLLFKGEQIAHLCYDRPDLRPRMDTDLLVQPEDRLRAATVLEGAGFQRVPQLEADLISYQAAFVKHLASVPFPIDLHWRVSNPQEFGDPIPLDVLFSGASAIPGLGHEARGPNPVHALILSLVHPVAHHSGRERLIWDLDSARLAATLTAADWLLFLQVVEENHLSSICAVRLSRIARTWGIAVPDQVLDILTDQSRREGEHASLRRRTRAGELVASVRALKGWGKRAALIRQHLLPPRRYMRDVYAPASRAPLALLYLRRAILGALKYRRPVS